MYRTDFWTLQERERVGFGRIALKRILPYVKQIASLGLMHGTGCSGRCTGMTLRDGMGREVGGRLRMGTHVYRWLIHVNV